MASSCFSLIIPRQRLLLQSYRQITFACRVLGRSQGISESILWKTLSVPSKTWPPLMSSAEKEHKRSFLLKGFNMHQYNSSASLHTKNSNDAESKSANEVNTDFRSKIRTMWKKYGIVFVGTYAGVYLSTLGGMFLALDNDLFQASALGVDPVETVRTLCRLIDKVAGSDYWSTFIHANPKVGTFLVGWALTKVTEPLRLSISVVITPSLSRALGRKEPSEN